MLEILQQPFMVRALLAGIIIAVLLGWLGVYVVTRKLSFIGDGIAHASLAGVAASILLGLDTLPVTIALSGVLAFAIFYLEKRVKISGDSAIAIIFTSMMALGVLILHFHDGYLPELSSFLFGNILIIKPSDVVAIAIFGAIIFTLLLFFNKKILFSTVDPIGAKLSGINTNLITLFLYISIAISVVLAIKAVGIVLVSALLVTPANISKITSKSFNAFQGNSIFWSLYIVIFGLILSYLVDLPSGAAIVLTGTATLLLVWLSSNKSLNKGFTKK